MFEIKTAPKVINLDQSFDRNENLRSVLTVPQPAVATSPTPSFSLFYDSLTLLYRDVPFPLSCSVLSLEYIFRTFISEAQNDISLGDKQKWIKK